MITKDSNITAVSIYNPHTQTWGQITGACLEEGQLRLIWVSDDKSQLCLMATDTVQTLFKSFNAAPF